jgi:structure-specific recognition protein 1
VVPRGKYTIDFYQKNLRFHGPTFNYNVDYKNIQRGFILPLSNEAQTAIVLQLAKPIHQGQTIHPFIVIQVKREAEINVKTKVKPEYFKESPHLENIKP